MDNNDRVYEAYTGSMGEKMQRQTQFRINWIVAQAEDSKTVLDVGCSQGITSLLLAEAGKQVTGVDIQKEAIEFAQQKLETEYAPLSQAGTVRFHCADFLDFPVEQTVDCVIMTEVLEHLKSPLPFLEKAAAVLNDNGKLIVTVPFGVLDHPDHYATYYLTSIYQAVSRYFTVTHFEFWGRWMGLIAYQKSSGRQPCVLDEAALSQEEENFLKIDRDLTDRNLNLYTGLQQSNEKYQEAMVRYSTMQEWHQASLDKNKQLEEQIKTVKEWHQTSLDKNKQLEEQIKTVKEWHQASLDKNKQLEEQIKTVREQHQTSLDKNKQLEEQIKTVKEWHQASLDKNKQLEEQIKAVMEQHQASLDQNKQLEEELAQKEALEREYHTALSSCDDACRAEIALLEQVKKSLQQLQIQNDYLKRENAEYRRKFAKITDTWYGKFALRCYHILQKVRRKWFSSSK